MSTLLIGQCIHPQPRKQQNRGEIIKEMGYAHTSSMITKYLLALCGGAFNEKDLTEKHNAELLQKRHTE